nr:peptidase C48, SUMO/sentrin/Ubl1 [Tanacetum cinerariifolium]
MLDVKGICRVSPMKSKVTGKSDSPRRRWILLSERVSNKHGDIVVNAQPVSQYNPVTVQVVKEGDKVQQPKVKPAVDEKDNPKVKLVVVKEKPTVVKEKTAGVTSKVSKGNDDVVKAPVVADEVPVIIDKELVVKATVADKAPAVKATVADNVVADKQPVESQLVLRDNVKAPVEENVEVSVLKGNLLVDVVPDDMVLNKAMGKASVKNKFKASVKDKVEDNVKVPVKDKPNKKDNVKAPVKDKPKQKVMPTVQELSEVLVLRSSNQKVKPEVKYKVVVRVSRLKETHVKRKRILSKEDDRKKKLKGKSKKEDFDSKLETDDVDSSSDEVDRKRKKLKIKAGLTKKRSGSDCSDSSSIDTENIKRLISKLEKKVKKEESDEEIVPKKGKKKEEKLTPEEAAHKEYLLSFLTSRARTTPSSLFSAIQNSRVNLSFLSGIGFSSLHNVSIDQLPSKLGRGITITSSRNALEHFIALTVGKYTSRGITITSSGNVLEHFIPNKSHEIRQDLIVMLEEYMRKASLEYPDDGKFLALHEKYVNLFKDPISFNDDGNGDNGGDDDDGNRDNDGDDCGGPLLHGSLALI